jgi:hypothetical protein
MPARSELEKIVAENYRRIRQHIRSAEERQSHFRHAQLVPFLKKGAPVMLGAAGQ